MQVNVLDHWDGRTDEQGHKIIDDALGICYALLENGGTVHLPAGSYVAPPERVNSVPLGVVIQGVPEGDSVIYPR